MTIGAGGGGDSWLVRILNRIFRCSHQRQTRPITPRGGGQTYAVCLDCGMRLVYDLSAMGVRAPVHGSPLDRQVSEAGKGVSAHGPIPAAPEREEMMWRDSRRAYRGFGTPVVLWIGAISLAGGLFYLLDQPAGTKKLTAPKPARPSLSTRSANSSRSLPLEPRERDAEMSPAYEATTPANLVFFYRTNLRHSRRDDCTGFYFCIGCPSI